MENAFNSVKAYAGVGSRSTPKDVLDLMSQTAIWLAQHQWVLRSGGANGADWAFEEGCRFVNGKMNIYLPWKGFNHNPSNLFILPAVLNPPSPLLDLVKKYHPAFDSLPESVIKLMARNCYQILGLDLSTPVKFVICWTADGKDSGGTGFAIRMANDLGIKVFNLFNQEDRQKIEKKISEK